MQIYTRMEAYKIDDSQGELFRNRLKNQINEEHELVELARLIDWEELEGEYGSMYMDNVAGGQPAKPIRLMVGMILLQNMHNLSDREVVRQWMENVYWQYFCGYDYLQISAPIEASSLTRFRKRVGKGKLENLLSITVTAAVESGLIKKRDCERVTVDTTIMPKNIEYPTDSKLIEKARKKLVKLAKNTGIVLRQNYNRVAKRIMRQICGYLHAKQMKRAKKAIKRLKTITGRIMRDCRRKIENMPDTKEKFERVLGQTEHLLTRKPKDKNKLYSLHEDDISCISKGKAHKKYEFGSKVSLSIINEGAGIITGCESLSGAPYDGHTLKEALTLSQEITGVKVKRAFVDKGYKGHKVTDTDVFVSGQRKNLTGSIKKQLKRRQAIEPHIGHMKQSCKLGLSRLKGSTGDQINALLSASAYNLKLILNHLRILVLFFRNFIQQNLPHLILKFSFAL